MKGFGRENLWLSLCGLNCGLCPMQLSGHCGGCGNGNQSCAIARCSLTRGGVAYCFECDYFPCTRYHSMDGYDSFITHQRQMADLMKAQRVGMDAYNQEQAEKRATLEWLLRDYNDGRRKNFYCVAVNLLPLEDVRDVMAQLANMQTETAPSQKERAAMAVRVFKEKAAQRKVSLVLRKKK